MLVNDRVPAPSGDHVAVGPEGERIGNRKAGGDAAVKKGVAEPGLHRAGQRITVRLSIASMIVMEIVSAARAVETTAPAAIPARTNGTAVRPKPKA